MPASETRIAARDKSGVEVYYEHSTLPTKDNVAAYEAFHQGAAKIMLDMAVEDQKQYWIATQRRSKTDCYARILGMSIGFLVSVMLICSGTYLMATDHYVTGSASVIIALISLLGTIISGGKKS